MSDKDKKSPPKKPKKPVKLPIVRRPTPSTEVTKGNHGKRDKK